MSRIDFDIALYDPDADVLYLSIGDPERAVDFAESSGGHALRYDEHGDLVGITIVGARRSLTNIARSDNRGLAERKLLRASFAIPNFRGRTMSRRRKMPPGSHRAAQSYINSLSDAEYADLVADTREQLRDDPDQRQALLEEMRRTPLPRWAGEASRYGAVLEALRARAASAMNLNAAELDTPEGTLLEVGSTTAMAALQPAIVAGHVHVTPDTLLAVQDYNYSRDELWAWALEANLPLPWMLPGLRNH